MLCFQGGHGGALVPLVNAVVAHPSLTWVYGRNEHDAATMAAAHAKLTGELGVVIATSGPGATNLTTGLLEAVMDQVPLLSITGMKPRDVLGYSEFQDVNQSRLFAAIGIEWSKDAASPHAVIPLLRDAVATAVTKRTAVHLAIPVDVQAAPSPLSIDRPFCASNSNLRFNAHHASSIDAEEIELTAKALVGKVEDARMPRNVIAVGLRAAQYPVPLGWHIMELAQALDAPVLTRLDAKGTVDERHPLCLGVIGVHGKPGLEQAAKLISTADCVVSIGVTDETLLLCNSAGLQIRRCIEIQPDALATGTRYQAEHTLLGDMAAVIERLTKCVQESTVRAEKKRRLSEGAKHKTPRHSRHRSEMVGDDASSYLTFNNPMARRRSTSVDRGTVEMFLPHLDEAHQEDEFAKSCEELWNAMHSGNVRKSWCLYPSH
jgi:thiamine pyrophosphate-dependent acetolactate synthase large subunit-like protein